MESDITGMDDRFARASAELQALRGFPGAAKEFWPRFLAACAQLAQADSAVLLAGRAGQQPRWMKLGDWHAGASRPRTNFNDFLEQAAERATREGSFVEEDDGGAGGFSLGAGARRER